MGLDNDDIKALIAILQKGLTNDDENEVETPKRKTQRSSKPRQTKKKSTNKFDNMPEFGMCKEDVEIQCRICGKKDKVAPSILESMEIERYKCNKCATGAG